MGRSASPSRGWTQETEAQQVTDVERGYNLFEANCARCHGVNGEGGIGPVLNGQDKLFAHLNENYLRTVLTVGGRYVCGDPNSLMPVWSNQANPPGPLNYRQIEELIAFLRATNDQEYIVRDPELGTPKIDPVTGKVKTFTGWRDPNYKPGAGATPYPACWNDEFDDPVRRRRPARPPARPPRRALGRRIGRPLGAGPPAQRDHHRLGHRLHHARP